MKFLEILWLLCILLLSFFSEEKPLLDTQSNLIWQSDVSHYTLKYQEAQDYCKNLDEGSFTNWKVPSFQEYATLKNSDIIDIETYFEGIFWSRDSLDSTPMAVEFFNKKYLEKYDFTDMYQLTTQPKDRWYVRCVSENENNQYEAFEKQYISQEEIFFYIAGATLLIIILYRIGSYLLYKKREKYILAYRFSSPNIKTSLQRYYPHLNSFDVNEVESALRHYFLLCNDVGNKTLTMPSKVVYTAWMAFIGEHKAYSDFCDKAFGYYLIHESEESFTDEVHLGLRRAYCASCKREHINKSFPQRLPILFAIDKKLQVSNTLEHTLEKVRTLTCPGIFEDNAKRIEEYEKDRKFNEKVDYGHRDNWY